MDWSNLFGTLIQLAVFSVFVTSIIEVLKGVSAIGIKGIVSGLWNSLVRNDNTKLADGFPVLNFAVALLCCWAFNVTIMSRVFENVLFTHASLTPMQVLFARWIDYFGTASVVYAGSDQLFKRFIAVKQEAQAALAEVKP